jgi:hypothetical protein
MAGVISFSDDPIDIWMKAGWAFRQILSDVLQAHPEDNELRDIFDGAEAVNGLSINTLPPEVALRATNSLRYTVNSLLDGRLQSGLVKQSYGNARTLAQYRECLLELAAMIPSSTSFS